MELELGPVRLLWTRMESAHYNSHSFMYSVNTVTHHDVAYVSFANSDNTKMIVHSSHSKNSGCCPSAVDLACTPFAVSRFNGNADAAHRE